MEETTKLMEQIGTCWTDTRRKVRERSTGKTREDPSGTDGSPRIVSETRSMARVLACFETDIERMNASEPCRRFCPRFPYVTVQNIQELQQRIQSVCAVSVKRASQSMIRNIDARVAANGGHYEQLLRNDALI